MIDHNCYGETTIGQVSYLANHVVDANLHTTYLKGSVKDRLFDSEEANQFEQDLQALGSTLMASSTIRAILEAPASPKEGWEIGEAWAEDDLEKNHHIVFPWNMARDKRSPRASLQGADLVGLRITADKTILAFGEVKTSNDSGCPPSVMTGRSGMIHQLQTLCSDWEVRQTLLKWLHARCKGTTHWKSYQAAVKRYIESGGLDCYLFGYLMRDTEHKELDLKNRATALSQSITAPMEAKLFAWYFPNKIDEWHKLMVD